MEKQLHLRSLTGKKLLFTEFNRKKCGVNGIKLENRAVNGVQAKILVFTAFDRKNSAVNGAQPEKSSVNGI